VTIEVERKHVMKGKQKMLHERIKKMNLDKNFTYHPPKEGQPEKYATIRKMAHEYAEFLQENCPQSRELSLALTNLEQTVMWANASIARNS